MILPFESSLSFSIKPSIAIPEVRPTILLTVYLKVTMVAPFPPVFIGANSKLATERWLRSTL